MFVRVGLQVAVQVVVQLAVLELCSAVSASASFSCLPVCTSAVWRAAFHIDEASRLLSWQSRHSVSAPGISKSDRLPASERLFSCW